MFHPFKLYLPPINQSMDLAKMYFMKTENGKFNLRGKIRENV